MIKAKNAKNIRNSFIVGKQVNPFRIKYRYRMTIHLKVIHSISGGIYNDLPNLATLLI
jgi:hypothetical protein